MFARLYQRGKEKGELAFIEHPKAAEKLIRLGNYEPLPKKYYTSGVTAYHRERAAYVRAYNRAVKEGATVKKAEDRAKRAALTQYRKTELKRNPLRFVSPPLRKVKRR